MLNVVWLEPKFLIPNLLGTAKGIDAYQLASQHKPQWGAAAPPKHPASYSADLGDASQKKHPGEDRTTALYGDAEFSKVT